MARHVLIASFLCLVTVAGDVDARTTASIEIKTQNPNALADALFEVFTDDGFQLVFEAAEQMNFARQASRMKELAYGTPLDPGSTEMVTIDFFPINDETYRVECNVSIRVGAEASLTDSNVLPLFGRHYQRLLRRVKRAL